MKQLKAKQQVFVQEYLKDLNASQAALRAGYSKHSHAAMGQQLMAKPHIQAAIKDAIDARSKRTGVTVDRVVRELEKVAFSDMRKFVKWGPDKVQLNDSEDMGSAARAISEVSETTSQFGGSQKIKLYDKVRALELLGKHLGMFDEDAEGGGDKPPVHVHTVVAITLPSNGREKPSDPESK